jgi:GR25 family glycosyltransferase involved in LPS biosynthesis
MPPPHLLFHVLNLERRADRRAQFKTWNEEIPGLRFEFVSAVDGKVLDVDRARQEGLVSKAAKFSTGQIACGLSHRNVLLAAQQQDRPVFVCEDDAVFRHDFVAQWQMAHSQLPADWDFMLFGYNFDSAISMELIPGVQSYLSSFDNRPIDTESLRQFRMCFQPSLVRRLSNAFGTPAYAVSPHGAEKVLKACFPLRNVQVPIPCLRRVLRAFSIDCLLNLHYDSWSAFASFPPLVVTPNDKTQSDTAR